jgi:hypothetical protein
LRADLSECERNTPQTSFNDLTSHIINLQETRLHSTTILCRILVLDTADELPKSTHSAEQSKTEGTVLINLCKKVKLLYVKMVYLEQEQDILTVQSLQQVLVNIVYELLCSEQEKTLT